MVRRPLRFALASVALLLSVSACKQEDRTIEAKDYPGEMASGYCEAVYSCPCDSYPYANSSVCQSQLDQAYSQVAFAAAGAGLKFDGRCAIKELDQLSSLACSSSATQLPTGVCAPPCNAWYGSLPAGSFCTNVAVSAEAGVGFSNCAQGLSCLGGVCLDPCQLGNDLPGLGQPCPGFVCASGAVCDLESQICVVAEPLPGPGESCANGVCDPMRAVCVAEVGVCAALPSVGQPCVSGLCDAQSYCGSSDVCVARPPLVCGLLAGGIGGDGDGDPTGDGDGDPTTGDGDGDPTTGDGDGDPTTGDGDGDPTTGDGDGDPTTGDGDGDPGGNCGWNPGSEWYECGGQGSDPSGTNPYACPPGLIEGAACGAVGYEGCCDANGDNWYCGEDDTSTFLVLDLCQ
jgi:hypothetical protein